MWKKVILPRSSSYGFDEFVSAASDLKYFKGTKPVRFSGPIWIYEIQNGGNQTLFIGDSHMQQCFPRISELCKNGKSGSQGCVFFTLGGMIPIPGVTGEMNFPPDTYDIFSKKMLELAKKDEPVSRQVMPRDQAVEFFKQQGELYKAEIIASIPQNEEVSLYTEGKFTDLCRGPHVPSTGKLKVFKLMKVAGAYWRGDAKNEMLQRIYGTAWAKKEDQEAYLHMLEEAEKRDHRRLAKQLDLFHMQDAAPGLVFWHPKGWILWQEVEQYMRRVYRENGYQEVRCPQILDRSLWERSGHWENYKENMFTTASENRDYALKPMNCPGHVQVFNQGLRSYREIGRAHV